MTREEAISFGNMWLELNEDAEESETYQFFKMAISALSENKCFDGMTNGEVIQAIWNVSNIKVYKVSVFAEIYPCKDMRFDKSWWTAEFNGSLSVPERAKEKWKMDDGTNAVCPICNKLNGARGDFCKWCGADMRGE